MLYIFIANYKPEFVDGRVQRVHAIEKYFQSKNVDYKVVSLGTKNEEDLHSIKFASKVLIQSQKTQNKKVANEDLFLNIKYKLFRLLNKIVWPDRYVIDSLKLYSYIRKEITQKDTILISVPWFSFLLFSFLPCKNIYLDFRDLYLGNKIFSRIKFLDKALLKTAIAKTKKIIVTTYQAKEQLELISYSKDIAVIPNGITENQYDFIKNFRTSSQDNTKKNLIGYFGNLGGKRDAFDLLSMISKSNLQMRLVGSLSEEYLEKYKEFCSENLQWEDMIKSAMECEYLLVIIREDEHAEFAIPGKVYEYIALQKPIILYSPKNAAVRLFLLEINYKHAWVDSEEHIEKHFNIHDIEFKGLLECEPVIRERYFEKEFSQF